MADATTFNALTERIIGVLRRDARMPPLTVEEWRLLFADAVSRSRDELGELLGDAAVPDFNAGGYRYKDLLREGIVSSRGNLNYLQVCFGFPKPIKTAL